MLTLEVPGLKQDDFNISVENNVLAVRGQRQWSSEQKEENYQRVERRYGSFSRSFALPQTVDPQEVHASYEAGILRVELKKRPELKSQKITVPLGRAPQYAQPIAEAPKTEQVPVGSGQPAS